MSGMSLIVEQLQLQPHPEGGFYKRVFASEQTGEFGRGQRIRPLCTSIVYLLQSGEYSSFHRIKSDELWQLGESNTSIRLIELHSEGIVETQLSRQKPVYCVKANTWFAAELVNNDEKSYALAYCTVVPGFDFADFDMAAEASLLLEYPECSAAITRLCSRQQ